LCFGQEVDSIIGKYTTNNKSHFFRDHYERITLNEDSSFNYFVRIGSFVKIKIEGKWNLIENELILHGNHPALNSEVSVIEKIDDNIPDGKVRINVTDLDGNSLIYHLSATKGDTTIEIRNRESSTLIPFGSLDSFCVRNTLLKLPTYEVQKLKANDFYVKISKSRVIIDEKWVYKNGVLFPRGLSQDYSTYYLSKE
jgi:hypothetical protein